MGITSPLQPRENSSNGADVSKFDKVPDPEDEANANHPFGKDVEAFTRFMRSTKAPAKNADGGLKAADLEAGEKLFRDKADNGKKTGCAICHVPDWNTLPVGHPLPGNFPDNKVPEALGGKTIHPFSDFLLHDVGTGDGIVQNGGASTRNKVRTAPLWGMRTRNRLMHDGETLTRNEAILRYFGGANPVINNYLTWS